MLQVAQAFAIGPDLRLRVDHTYVPGQERPDTGAILLITVINAGLFQDTKR